MDAQARVTSLDRLEEFRAAYAKFGDSARQALLGVEIEIRRMTDWLEKDIVAYWKAEIRRREERVNEARQALHRKRLTAAFGHVVGDTDEVVQLRKAKARLEQAEEKLKIIKQWAMTLEQEINEYRGPSQLLGNLLDADVPRALSSLSRMLESLEGYLQIAAPSSEASLGGEFASAAVPGAASTPADVAAAPTAEQEGLEPDAESTEEEGAA